MNGEKLTKDRKVEINHKDSITFKDCEVEVVFRIKKIKRERSRSRSESSKKIEDIKIPSDEKETKEETKHIKSEVIWNAVEFENKNKKDKFLRLLGANKHKKETENNNVSKNLSEQLTNNFKKIERDLEQQFFNSRGRK